MRVDYNIKPISTDEALMIRHEVMWPDMDFDFVRVNGDDQADHYGLFVKEELVSVVSMFIDNDCGQFRKFATKTKYQNQGWGSKLLSYVLEKYEFLFEIRCNARIEKISYYKKFGFHKTETMFTKSNQDYIVMKKKGL